jgi:hypothetical protein
MLHVAGRTALIMAAISWPLDLLRIMAGCSIGWHKNKQEKYMDCVHSLSLKCVEFDTWKLFFVWGAAYFAITHSQYNPFMCSSKSPAAQSDQADCCSFHIMYHVQSFIFTDHPLLPFRLVPLDYWRW